jgi:hypothetical protein
MGKARHQLFLMDGLVLPVGGGGGSETDPAVRDLSYSLWWSEIDYGIINEWRTIWLRFSDSAHMPLTTVYISGPRSQYATNVYASSSPDAGSARQNDGPSPSYRCKRR